MPELTVRGILGEGGGGSKLGLREPPGLVVGKLVKAFWGVGWVTLRSTGGKDGWRLDGLTLRPRGGKDF